MCRLLGFVCDERARPVDVLGGLEDTWRELAEEHHDGWGIAWRDRQKLHRLREPGALHSSATYHQLLTTMSTDAALMHLRLASPGLDVSVDNTHPFRREDSAFAHNGFVGSSPAREHLLAAIAGEQPEGSTDSELYFLAVRSAIAGGSAPPDALLRVATELIALPGTISANAMLLSDDALHVVCAHVPDARPAGRPEDHFSLHYSISDAGCLVGSQELARAGWTELPNGSVLTIRFDDPRRPAVRAIGE